MLRDSALTWLEEFRCDGLRFDSTVFLRYADGIPSPTTALPDGLSLMAWINDEVEARLHAGERHRDDGAVTIGVDRLERFAAGQARRHQARVEQVREHRGGRRRDVERALD